MNYMTGVIRSLSLSNFKKGFDEEQIYGSLCVFGLIGAVLLLILNIISLKIFLFILFITLYIFFVYFPFHKNNTIGFFAVGVPVALIGAYTMFSGKVFFYQIKILVILWWVYLTLTFLVEYFALKKNSIVDIDLVIGYIYTRFGFIPAASLVPAAYVAFVLFSGTYFLFGKEHIYLWIPIFFFWTISIIRLIIYKVIK